MGRGFPEEEQGGEVKEGGGDDRACQTLRKKTNSVENGADGVEWGGDSKTLSKIGEFQGGESTARVSSGDFSFSLKPLFSKN